MHQHGASESLKPSKQFNVSAVGLSNVLECGLPAPGVAELELVISLKDTLGGGLGGVQIWELPGSSDNYMLWRTGRGNWRRQGYVPPS